MRIAVAGVSGFLGRRLRSVIGPNKNVVAISRTPAANDETSVKYDPATGLEIGGGDFAVDAFVNLAGENIGDGDENWGPILRQLGRWTAAKKTAMLTSRVNTTRAIVDAIRRMDKKPKVFVCASGVGYYGNSGDVEVDESSPPGDLFLTRISEEVEAEAMLATEYGVRVVNLRFGVMLGQGGALEKMYPAYRDGFGGPIAGGKHYMPWVSLTDAARAVVHAVEDERLSGPVNVVGPEQTTNYTFSQTLGRQVGRGANLPMPAIGIKLLFGEMGTETVLSGQRVKPRILQETGFAFTHPTLKEALSYELHQPA